MTRPLKCLVVLATAVLAGGSECAPAADSRTGEFRVVVSPGDDADGALDKAFAEVAQIRRQTPLAHITVVFRDGEYRLTRPITIDRTLDGGGQLRLAAATPGRADISGARILAIGDAVSAPEAINAAAPASCRGRLLGFRLTPDERLSLRQANFAGGSGNLAPPALFEGDQALTIARWPATGFQDGRDGAPPAARMAGWRSAQGIWAGGYWLQDYQYEIRSVALGKGQEIRFPARDGKAAVGDRWRYAIFNDPADLTPGGYVIDLDDGLVVACPRGEGGDLEIATARGLLQATGVRNLFVSGLSFRRATADAVVFDRSTDVVFENGHVGEVGGRGVVVTEGVRNVIVRTVVEAVGETGISLSGGQRGSLVSGGNAIIDSIIVDFGQWMRSYRPGVVLSGVGNLARGNFIGGGPHAGLLLFGNNHVVEGNEITTVLLDEGDAGAVYGGRDWTQQGTVIRRNLLHDIGRRAPRPGGAWQTGVYLDDFASGYRVEQNIFARVSQPVLVGGGRSNTIAGNAFFDSWPYAVTVDSRGTTWAASMVTNPQSPLRQAFAAAPVASEVYRRAYPQLEGTLRDEPQLPKYLNITANEFYRTRPYAIAAPASGNRIDAPGSDVARGGPELCAWAARTGRQDIDRRNTLRTLPFYALVSQRLSRFPSICR